MVSKAEHYIDSLTAEGRFSFTIDEFCHELELKLNAGLAALNRLKKQQKIASPSKGYYLVLTPEFRQKGCLPADFFIDDLMQHLQQSHYYVALLSAGLYHGAAHQQPQFFQVMLSDKRHNIQCANTMIKFIQNVNCHLTPIQQIKTRTGYMRVSTPEATAMDLVKYIRQCGGINRVATVLDELTESMQPVLLKELAEQSQEYSWIHRLGFLCDKLNKAEFAEILYEICYDSQVDFIPLVSGILMKGAKRDKKWRIAINVAIESDLDDTT